MAVVYKWNRYSIQIPSLSWGSLTGDVPLQQTHSPGNNIAAVGFKNLSSLQKRFGYVGSLDTLWFWLSESDISHTFVTNELVDCASYPYILLAEYSAVGALVGWHIGYASSGKWKTTSAVNTVYHTAANGTTYASYQSASCPNKSECSRGTLIDTVTSSSPNAYPYNDIAYSGNFPENGFWYEYVGSEDTTRYTVTLIVSPSNGGTVSGGGEYAPGDRAIVSATPNEGYEFVGWQENGILSTTSSSISFDVKSNRTLTAIFKQKLHLWVGVSDKARKGTAMWVGVNGKARKIVGAWVGVNGKARRFL